MFICLLPMLAIRPHLHASIACGIDIFVFGRLESDNDEYAHLIARRLGVKLLLMCIHVIIVCTLCCFMKKHTHMEWCFHHKFASQSMRNQGFHHVSSFFLGVICSMMCVCQ